MKKLLLTLILVVASGNVMAEWVEVNSSDDLKMNNLEWSTHARWINHHLLFRNKLLSSAYKEWKHLNNRLRSRS